MAEVSVSGVFKRFGPVAALSEIDLTVHDNEFVVLVGPSGSGKSTLLRIVAGLERQSEGAVAIDGRDMAGVAPKDRDVAMVFQSHALYPHMNVFDNLAFNQRIRGVDRKTVDAKVREVAERLEITELLKRRPRQMSGGQRQRSPSAGRWCGTRASSSSTSRSPISMPSCGSGCAPSSSGCTGSCGAPRSTSPTTRWRP